MDLVGSGFCDDVDHATSRAAKFRVRATGDNLELLHCIERDVNGCTLTAELLAKETVVVVTTVEADVVEDTALTVEVDLVAVGALGNRDTRSESQQVFKFAP